MSVRVAEISQSPWPEMAGYDCDGQEIQHPAKFVVWTDEDTGDGMRFACPQHIGDWVISVWDRIDGDP